MSILLYAVAIGLGVVLTSQIGTNTLLGRAVGNPYLAGAANMLSGLVLAAGLVAFFPLPSRSDLGHAPWWAWPAGGALGVAYLTGNILLAPRIGLAALTGLIVVGQLCWSVALDHFGWLGFEQHSASLWRLAGLVLMIAGVALVARG